MRFKNDHFWLAIGLVAVFGLAVSAVLTLRADAAADTSDSTFVAMSPCRLFDTRPEYDIGSLATFGPDDTQTIPAHGDTGDCAIPTDAIALSLNLTAVNATLPTHVTLWPEGVMPTVSSLNPTPGAVAFNAVTVPLASGAFQVYNLQGTLDVIADVNGYYRASTIDDLETRLTQAEMTRPVVASRGVGAPQVIDDTARWIVSVEAPEPLAPTGTMIANYSVNVEQDEAGAIVECHMTDEGGSTIFQRWESPGNLGGSGTISGSARLSWSSPPVPAAFLVCRHSGASSPTIATGITANVTFYPDADQP